MSKDHQVDKEKEKKFILELIEVYRSLTALWDVNNKDYANRGKKEEQYRKLLAKYRERYPKATKKEVNRKIHILRSNFQRELRRLRTQNHDLSERKLWYFDAFAFLKDVMKTTLNESCFNEDSIQHYSVIRNEAHFDNEPKIEPKKGYKKVETQKEEPKKETTTRVSSNVFSSKKIKKKKLNGLEKMSEVWSVKLQGMDFDQAIIAEKLINDVIFNGLLNKLTMDSQIVNEKCYTSPKIFTDILRVEDTIDSEHVLFSDRSESMEYKHEDTPSFTGEYK